MPERTGYPEGAPCWLDAIATDMASAQRFYGELLGWSFEDQGEESGHYTMAKVGAHNVAALMPPMPGSEGAPPAWNVYFATADVDAAVQRIEQHGGKLAMGPMTVMTAGRMAMAVDPTGAVFGLWQADQHVGSTLLGEPGAPGWFELNTRNGAAADQFYQAVFGYEDQRQIGDGTEFDYTEWKAGGEPVCGRYQSPGDAPAHWMPYFEVASADEAAATAARLGGRVEREPWDTEYGRMVALVDPNGIRLMVSERPPSQS